MVFGAIRKAHLLKIEALNVSPFRVRDRTVLSLVRPLSGGGERLQLQLTGNLLHKRSAEAGWNLD